MRTKPSPLHLIAVTGVIFFCVALHTYHFSGRPYRQDEAWSVHGNLLRDTRGAVQWMITGTHPPGWQIGLNAWVNLFGDDENITRFMSTLLTVMVLAFVYRTAADLFDRRTALLSVLLLGTLPFFQFFIHETRPYALLMFGNTGAMLFFVRWLRKPTFTYALLYVAFGIISVYTHYFGVYLLAGQVVFGLLFVRWDRGLYLRAAGLLGAIGLSLVAWVLPFIYAVFYRYGDGIAYSLPSSWSSLVYLHDQMILRPVQLGQLLLLGGVVLPVSLLHRRVSDDQRRFRFHRGWRKAYVIVLPAVMLLAAFAGNLAVSNLTPRNLVIILPPLTILAAFALRSMPWQLYLIAVILLLMSAVQNFRTYIAIGPYHEITEAVNERLQPNSRFVMNGALVWEHIPLLYYLRTRLDMPLPNNQFFHLFTANERMGSYIQMPDPPVNYAVDSTETDLQRFAQFIGDSPQVWYIQITGVDFGTPYREWLNTDYIRYNQMRWGRQEGYSAHLLEEYRRIPPEAEELFYFRDNAGLDQISLQYWKIDRDVRVHACESVELETWWQTDDILSENYNMTMVITDTSGMGVGQTDAGLSPVLSQQWQPGQFYLDERNLTIPCELPPGDYPLLIGVYEPINVTSLNVFTAQGANLGTLLYLTTLVVTP